MSNTLITQTGVPQGTTLGPLFFVAYVNGLLQRPCIAYTDDTVVFCDANTWFEAEAKMNALLSEVGDWLAFRELSLNVDKSAYVTFGSYKDSIPDCINLRVNGTLLTGVSSIRYLGVLFDSHMTWGNHIEKIVNKCKYFLYTFHRLKNVLTRDQLTILYHALCHCHINYGIIGWGGAYKNVANVLQSVQNLPL